MSDQQLREAFALMKNGQKQEAEQIIRNILKTDRSNERAWWMMVHLLDDEEKKRKAVDRVLSLNPNHQGALKLLQQEQAVPVAETPESPKEKRDYWSKLENRQKKGFKPKQDTFVHSGVKGIGRYIIRNVIVTTIIIAVATSYYFLRDYIPVGEVSGPPPEEVVKLHFTAAFNDDTDTMLYYTCDNLDSHWTEFAQSANEDLTFRTVGRLGVDFSRVETEIIESRPRAVTVRITGRIIISAEDRPSNTVPFSDMFQEEALELRVEVADGHWVVCS